MKGRINIAGWSPYHIAGGVTGHVLAMSEMAAVYYGLNVDVRADHFGTRPLESYIYDLRRVQPISERTDFYSSPDYPDYSRCVLQYEKRFYSGTRSRAESYLLNDRLRLLRPVGFRDESVFKGGCGDVCFVDSSGKNSPYSFRVLNEADMVMVFLPGNPVEIRRFFFLYYQFISKSFFIINRIPHNEDYLLNIPGEFKVPKTHVSSIPYCPEFARACASQTVDKLIIGQIGRSSYTQYFLHIKNLTKQVLIAAQAFAKARRGIETEPLILSDTLQDPKNFS